MKLLLCKTIEELGIVGDVVTVSRGYARNYLLPQGLATEPTEANMRALAEARRAAELERARKRTELEALAERLKGVEVTVRAKANEQGVLYGSVGAREIAEALAEEGVYLRPEQIALDHSIRRLDSVDVPIRLASDLTSSVKVWVVRESAGGSEDASSPDEKGEAEAPGTEAAEDDHGTN